MLLLALATALAQPAPDLAHACVDTAGQERLALDAGDLDAAAVWAAEADRACTDLATVLLDGAPLDAGIVFDAGDGLLLGVETAFELDKPFYFVYHLPTPPPPPPPTEEATDDDEAAPPPVPLVRKGALPTPPSSLHPLSWGQILD